MKKDDEIKAVVRERFKAKYPNTDNSFREHMDPFISFIVEETLKEARDGN